MELDFTSFDEKYDEYENVYQEILKKALSLLDLTFKPIISVTIVDNKTIHQINKEYRNIDRETDVISFAFIDDEEDKEKIKHSKIEYVLGDIYISVDKAISQAEEYGHSLHRELCFLFTHGLLHLLGYDHMEKEDEVVMFNLQNKILNEMGINR